MADIKTRDAVKGTIKTIDKAAIASERMKSAYVGINEKPKTIVSPTGVTITHSLIRKCIL